MLDGLRNPLSFPGHFRSGSNLFSCHNAGEICPSRSNVEVAENLQELKIVLLVKPSRVESVEPIFESPEKRLKDLHRDRVETEHEDPVPKDLETNRLQFQKLLISISMRILKGMTSGLHQEDEMKLVREVGIVPIVLEVPRASEVLAERLNLLQA